MKIVKSDENKEITHLDRSNNPGDIIKPKKKCKYCYGRGYIGTHIVTKQRMICHCVMKQA